VCPEQSTIKSEVLCFGIRIPSDWDLSSRILIRSCTICHITFLIMIKKNTHYLIFSTTQIIKSYICAKFTVRRRKKFCTGQDIMYSISGRCETSDPEWTNKDGKDPQHDSCRFFTNSNYEPFRNSLYFTDLLRICNPPLVIWYCCSRLQLYLISNFLTIPEWNSLLYFFCITCFDPLC
jgi:hypothetical protein